MSSDSVDIVRCGICKKLFNQDDRKPKFLQCYHTYCYKCLTNIQEKNKKKKTNGGGVEFPCPSCHKVTRVGKKGVSLLPDNFYVPLNTTRKTQQDEVYLSDDDDNDNGDGYDDSTAKTVDAAKSREVKVWCNTCLKVADAECSAHDICNLELGKKRLNERLHHLLEQAGSELDREIKLREPQLCHLQAAHDAWTSSLVAHLEEEMNTQSMALTVAHSELELLDNFKKLSNEDDPANIVSAINSIEGMLTSKQSRLKAAVKQATLMSALQICRIKIQPVLDSHNNTNDKPQNLLIEIAGSNSNEEKALVYLMYHILEEKGGKTGTVDESWQVVDRARKVKNKGGQEGQDGNNNQPSFLMGAVYRTNLFSTAATSTESLPLPHNTRIVINKDLGNFNKVVRCFFDIAIDGQMSGRVVIQLRPDVAPKMCANFVALCTGELGYGYKGCKIFKAIADSHIIGGDFEKNNGSGGHSIYNNKGLFLADSCGLRDEKGALRMKGMGTDERTGSGLVGSQFHIWVKDRDFKSYTRTLVIGRVIEGLDLCKLISNFKICINERGTYIINNDVVIQNCGKL